MYGGILAFSFFSSLQARVSNPGMIPNTLTYSEVILDKWYPDTAKHKLEIIYEERTAARLL